MKKTCLALSFALFAALAGVTACAGPSAPGNGDDSVDYASALKNSASAIAATITDEEETSPVAYSSTVYASNDFFKEVGAPVAATMVYFAGGLCEIEGYDLTQTAVQFTELFDFTFGGETVVSTQKMQFTVFLTVDAETDKMVLMIHHQVAYSASEGNAWNVDYNFVCDLDYDFEEEKLLSFKMNAYSGEYVYGVYDGENYLSLEGDELLAVETLFNGYYAILGEKEATASAGTAAFGQKYVEASQFCSNLVGQDSGISVHKE